MNQIPQGTTQFALKTNREIRSAQIHDCLSLIATLTNCIRLASGIEGGPGGESSGSTPPFSAIPLSALERSLGHACQRLDWLLATNKDWDLPTSDTHTAALKYFAQQLTIQRQGIQATQMQLETMAERLANETSAIRRGLELALQNPDLTKPLTEEEQKPI